MDRIILIGGAPTIGKSYVAKKVAEKLRVPWISTDTVRETMRSIVRKKDYPHLFEFSSGITADKYLSSHSPRQIFRDQNFENRDVWKGVKGLIEGDYVWVNFIIEGVAIMPYQARKVMQSRKKVKTVFLFSDDREKTKRVIFNRGLWDKADEYPDSVKEKEIDWVMLCNSWIKKEAQKYRLPLCEYFGNDNDIDRILKAIK